MFRQSKFEEVESLEKVVKTKVDAKRRSNV